MKWIWTRRGHIPHINPMFIESDDYAIAIATRTHIKRNSFTRLTCTHHWHCTLAHRCFDRVGPILSDCPKFFEHPISRQHIKQFVTVYILHLTGINFHIINMDFYMGSWLFVWFEWQTYWPMHSVCLFILFLFFFFFEFRVHHSFQYLSNYYDYTRTYTTQRLHWGWQKTLQFEINLHSLEVKENLFKIAKKIRRCSNEEVHSLNRLPFDTLALELTQKPSVRSPAAQLSPVSIHYIIWNFGIEFKKYRHLIAFKQSESMEWYYLHRALSLSVSRLSDALHCIMLRFMLSDL